MSRTPCPDCGAQYVGDELRHELTCPLMNSVEDVCDNDQIWFIEHPGVEKRRRPITQAELTQLRHIDPKTAAAATHVIVLDCPRGRIRSFEAGGLVYGMTVDLKNEGAA